MYVGPLVKFKDTTYSVVEGIKVFSVVIEKVGSTSQAVTLSVQFISGSAIGKQSL